MLPKPTIIALIGDATALGKLLLATNTIDISTADVFKLVNASNRQSLELMGFQTSSTALEGLRIRAVTTANYEIGAFQGSVSGSNRGLSFGIFERATPTVLTRWMELSNAGLLSLFGGVINMRRYGDVNTAMQFQVQKYRGTEAAPTALLANDVIGQFLFQGYNGSSIATSAALQARATENFASGATGTEFLFNSCSQGSSTSTERMRIRDDGVIQTNRLIGQASEVVSTPTGTTQTITLDSGRMQTLTLTSTTGSTTVTLTVPANVSAEGSIIVKQHGTTPRAITWAVSSGSIKWLGTQPTWSSDAVNAVRNVRWRWDGSIMYLESSAAG